MSFIIGFLLGMAVAFIVTCVVAASKIENAYAEGLRHGRELALHKVVRE